MSSTATSANYTETITSAVSGADENVGNWIAEIMSTLKLSQNDLSDKTKYTAFKLTRLGSSDSYSGTFQLINIKFFQ
jgi:hypothetical protein